MKNKYQEALDYVNKSVCTALNCLGIDDEQSRKSLHILQELVNKETPKKPYYEGDGYADGAMVYDMAYCPNCNNLMEEYEDNGWGEEYCHCCGQHLDWSDYDES